MLDDKDLAKLLELVTDDEELILDMDIQFVTLDDGAGGQRDMTEADREEMLAENRLLATKLQAMLDESKHPEDHDHSDKRVCQGLGCPLGDV